MNAVEHRQVADFLDSFYTFMQNVTGFASDQPYCFASQSWTPQQRCAILDEIKKRQTLELQNVDEIKQHPFDAQAMIQLFQLVISQISSGPLTS